MARLLIVSFAFTRFPGFLAIGDRNRPTVPSLSPASLSLTTHVRTHTRVYKRGHTKRDSHPPNLFRKVASVDGCVPLVKRRRGQFPS